MLTKLTFDNSLSNSDSTLDNRVRKSAKTSKRHTGADFIDLIKSWEVIVGKGYSDKTLPLKISYKTLYILTPHSSYSQQLSFTAHHIIKKIIEIHPSFEGLIKQIRFQVSPNFFDQKVVERQKYISKNKQNVMPHRFSPEYRSLHKQASEIYQDIEDTELKEQLISLYIQSVFSNK